MENVDLIRTVLSVTTAVPFVLFASAGIWHFAGALKSGARLVSVASLAGFVAILFSIWGQETVNAWTPAGVALQLFSVFLFGWCIGTSGQRNLSLAFSENSSPRLITEGPYSMVRHPFYTSYILFWVGGALAATSPFTVGSTVVLIAIYLFASRGEDAVLARRFAAEFPGWQKTTGAFFPKLR